MNRPAAVQPFVDATLTSNQATNSIPPQPFSPPAFVAPPPPLPSKPPVQSGDFTSQVSDPFALAPAKTSTSEFDPFADFDAKFSELALKNSSTVSAFASPAPVQAQPLPKSATVNSSFQAQQPPTAATTNPFQPEMFHHGSHPKSASGEKPAWLPSGFSTGLPPAHYTPAFGDTTQPKVATNAYGSIPKSNTLGAIAEVGTAVIPPNPASFDNIQQQAFSSSYANLAPNPFLAQPFGAQNVSHANFIPNSGPQYPQSANVMWNNPFASVPAQPRYGADSTQGVGGTPRQANNQNWNPFV